MEKSKIKNNIIIIIKPMRPSLLCGFSFQVAFFQALVDPSAPGRTPYLQYWSFTFIDSPLFPFYPLYPLYIHPRGNVI